MDLDLQKENIRLKQELKIAIGERDSEHALNKELKNILKKRSNADRDVRPKTQRSGYLFQQMQQRLTFTRRDPIITYETFLESPYPISMSLASAQFTIRQDLEELIMPMLEISSISNKDITILQKNSENIIFQILLKANVKEGYWLVIIHHTRPFANLPEDLLPAKDEDTENYGTL